MRVTLPPVPPFREGRSGPVRRAAGAVRRAVGAGPERGPGAAGRGPNGADWPGSVRICDHVAVTHPITRLLPALLLACAGLVLTAPAAQACKCDVPSVAQASRQADVVFTGVMRGEQRSGREADLAFAVERIYRGQVDAATLDVVTPTDSCGSKLVRGQTYVVFAREAGQGLVTDECHGTTRARDGVVERLERALGPGERYQPPVPEPVEPAYTRVAQGSPPELTRTAAPGAALALVGLLGWILVRRRA